METNKIHLSHQTVNAALSTVIHNSLEINCVHSFQKYLLHLASETQFIKCWDSFLENKTQVSRKKDAESYLLHGLWTV